MSGWRIFKEIAKRKAENVKQDVKGLFGKSNKKELVDKHLPLGLHVDGKVALDDVPFIINGPKFKTSFPGRDMEVAAYGVFNAGGATVHRFYLKGMNEAMIQIVVNEDGEMEESRLFVSIDEVYPQSKEEWGVWLADGDGLIGWNGFQHKDDESIFNRAWDESGDEWVEPVTFSETVYLDRYGDKQVTLHHAAMLYGRWIDGGEETAEYTLVSAEEHPDGKALVHIMCGIDYDPGFINVVY